MKAWVLRGINQFGIEEVDNPMLPKKEVLLEVKAAGICGSDIPRIYQTGTYSYPLIPGHEFSGIVKQLGAEANKKWLGKRVGVFPLIPCKKCMPCQEKKYEMCRNYSYLGSRRNGGFAEYVAVPEDNLIELPNAVSYEAAAMLEPMAVAVHAMRRALPTQNDKVLICGLGTIGTFLLMFLLDAGIRNILVIGNKEFQKKTVLSLGLSETCYCDSKKENVEQWVLQHTDGMGVNIYFECVGKNQTVSQAVNFTAPSGKVCLVGNPYSDMNLEKAVYWKILRNQLTIIGTWNSSFIHEIGDDWHYVLDKLKQGKILPEKLITHTYNLESLVDGFRFMRDKNEDYIKVMGVWR